MNPLRRRSVKDLPPAGRTFELFIDARAAKGASVASIRAPRTTIASSEVSSMNLAMA